MDAPNYFDTPQGRRLAYHRRDGALPGVVFLGGFMSDMTGTKALHLEAWAARTGRAHLRFDYSGHGQSDGRFEDGTIGAWCADAAAAIAGLTTGPQVLVGSSMGGWIAGLLARDAAVEVAGLVTIAAAPDFTEDGFWASFDADQRAELLEVGQITVPSDYDAPYTITRALIEDGRDNLLLRTPLALPMPVRFLQGTADTDVEVATALRIFEHAEGPDLRLCLVKGADHRFSDPACLALIVSAVEEVLSP